MAWLDEKKRCCGRKPLLYKKPGIGTKIYPFMFCPRCDRAYDMDGNQVENWAYKEWHPGLFVSKKEGSVHFCVGRTVTR